MYPISTFSTPRVSIPYFPIANIPQFTFPADFLVDENTSKNLLHSRIMSWCDSNYSLYPDAVRVVKLLCESVDIPSTPFGSPVTIGKNALVVVNKYTDVRTYSVYFNIARASEFGVYEIELAPRSFDTSPARYIELLLSRALTLAPRPALYMYPTLRSYATRTIKWMSSLLKKSLQNLEQTDSTKIISKLFNDRKDEIFNWQYLLFDLNFSQRSSGYTRPLLRELWTHAFAIPIEENVENRKEKTITFKYEKIADTRLAITYKFKSHVDLESAPINEKNAFEILQNAISGLHVLDH
jgi:hypothetical protein